MRTKNQFCERFKRTEAFAFKYFRSLPGGERLSPNKNRMACWDCGRKRTGTVYQDKGVWFYNCYGCGTCADVIRIIALREELKGKELISFLKEIAGEYDDFDFKINYPDFKSFEKISRNRELVSRMVKSQDAPNATWYIGSIYATKIPWLNDFLLKLIEIAEVKTKNADEIFTASLSEFGGRGEVHKLYLCRLAGLIEIADIPAALLPGQLAYQKKNGNKNLISAHYVPEWTETMIQEAIKIIIRAGEFGINTKSCTKSQIEAHFGPAALERVYHGITTRKPARKAPEALTMPDEWAARVRQQIEAMTTIIPEEKPTPKIDPWDAYGNLRDEKEALEKKQRSLNRKLNAGKNVTMEMVNLGIQLKNRISTMNIEMERAWEVASKVDFCSDEELKIRIENHYRNTYRREYVHQ